jgi:hypothetical protein
MPAVDFTFEVTRMDNRRFTRVGFTINASITIEGTTFTAEVENLSLHGLFVKNDRHIPLGTRADIAISLTGIQPEIVIRLKSVAVRSVAEGTGFEFESVDVNSFIHLRNIVAYARGDQDAVMAEFAQFAEHNLHSVKPGDPE